MTTKSGQTIVTISVSMPEIVRDRLETLVVKSGAISMSATVRNALAIYEDLLDRYADAKGMVTLADEDGNVERLRITTG